MSEKKVKVKKAAAAHQRIRVTTKQAKVRQNLGNGFFRYVYYYTINPNSYFTFTFNSSTLKPVSGGWWIQNYTSPAYATSNYSLTDNSWRTVVYNATNVSRSVAFTIIAKV